MSSLIWSSPRRRLATACVMLATVAAGLLTLLSARQEAATAEGGPALVIYSGPNFTGRSLRVTESLPDLPKSLLFDWNDTISSIVVEGGTWRLYENGRLNTFLDETPLEELDPSAKDAVGGWSCVVSANGGAARLTPDTSGWGDNSISSIELLSTDSMAAALARSPPAPPVTPPELILYEHVSRRGQELVLTDSVPELETGWDDALSSLEVNGGTWRLYELPHFDPAGWYVDVGGRGLVHEASESGGWTNDAVSSIELLSLENERPGWAVLDRRRPSRAGGE